MDIVSRLAQWAECDMRAEDVALAAKDEIERLRAIIADIQRDTDKNDYDANMVFVGYSW